MPNKDKKKSKNKEKHSEGHLNYEIAWHLGAIVYNYEHIASLSEILGTSPPQYKRF